MGFRTWATESRQQIRTDGVRGMIESVYRLYVGALGKLRVLRPGVSVYERDWDMLVLLDGCRHDLLASVADDYDFLKTVESHPSVGSTSSEWLRHTFDGSHSEAVAETIYVTGNIYTDETVDSSSFRELVEVWRTEWNDELGTVEPRRITDAAVHAAREHRPSRLIVHYMQPHYPFLTAPDLAPGMRTETDAGSVWDRLRRGELDWDRVLRAYEENLREVLEDVRVLLSSVDADRVVISADHGNAIGEWGVYGHPDGVPVPELRCVPWAVTTATDAGEYETTKNGHESDSGADPSVEEKLAALGYK